MQNINVIEASKIIKESPNAIMVDVRTPEEWRYGLAANDNLVLLTITQDLEEFQINLKDKILDQSNPILFICRGGARSAVAASLAEQIGYKNCYNIDGGMVEWEKHNLPCQEFDKI